MELQIQKRITEDEWTRIDIFKRRFRIFWGNLKDLNLRMIKGNFSKSNNGSYSGKLDLPSQYRLKGLYLDFRCFYADKEPTHFFKFAKFIASKVDDKRYYLLVHDLKRQWRSNFVESGWFKFEGKKITCEEILKLWFNGYMFHSDIGKYQKLLDLLELFEEETALSLLFQTVYDAGRAICNLHWSISDLTKERQVVRIPQKFARIPNNQKTRPKLSLNNR